MPIINSPIASRSWELVRNRVAAIIKDELFNQAAITYNDWLNCDVYTERWMPVGIDECVDAPVVNIAIESITPINETWACSNLSIMFNILVTAGMNATQTENNDTRSFDRNQTVCGVINGILMHPLYVQLLFPAPFIIRRRVVDVKFGTPERQESAGITLGIITFEVVCGQNEPESTGIPLGSSITSVTVNQTDKGYQYEI